MRRRNNPAMAAALPWLLLGGAGGLALYAATRPSSARAPVPLPSGGQAPPILPSSQQQAIFSTLKFHPATILKAPRVPIAQAPHAPVDQGRTCRWVLSWRSSGTVYHVRNDNPAIHCSTPSADCHAVHSPLGFPMTVWDNETIPFTVNENAIATLQVPGHVVGRAVATVLETWAKGGPLLRYEVGFGDSAKWIVEPAKPFTPGMRFSLHLACGGAKFYAYIREVWNGQLVQLRNADGAPYFALLNDAQREAMRIAAGWHNADWGSQWMALAFTFAAGELLALVGVIAAAAPAVTAAAKAIAAAVESGAKSIVSQIPAGAAALLPASISDAIAAAPGLLGGLLAHAPALIGVAGAGLAQAQVMAAYNAQHGEKEAQHAPCAGTPIYDFTRGPQTLVGCMVGAQLV